MICVISSRKEVVNYWNSSFIVADTLALQKEREERVRKIREIQEEERKKKIEELKQHVSLKLAPLEQAQ